MHGGVKFYRGSPAAARSYVEADRSRVDDYYLAEGTGLAERYVATPTTEGVRTGQTEGVRAKGPDEKGGVSFGGTLDGPAYERWVAGHDVETGAPKGRLRHDKQGLRFVEVVVNGPKTWSLAAALHPEIAAAYDAALDKAATEIIGWLADHATTRVGPRGRQVQVPIEQLEAAVVRHYTSRAGDPHRHLHLQINARVFAAGAWRGLHSVGVVDSIEAINGIGHAAVMCDPEFRGVLAAHGYALDPRRARSLSSRPTRVPSARGPRRSPATSIATRPNGATSTPTRSQARRCGGPGTVGHGPRRDPTRSCRRAEPNSSSGGSTSCTSWASLPQRPELSSVQSRSERSTETRRSIWCSPAWEHAAQAGTLPTSAARSSGSSQLPESWLRHPYATSWPKT